MLYLDINFSCTQRLMTPANPGVQKSTLEARICGLFASVFLLMDTGFHLLAGACKIFIWTAGISHRTSADYYKEGYSHFAKTFRCASLILFGTPLGIMCPSVFQSKKLQDYLGWKITSTRDQKSQTENVIDFSHSNFLSSPCTSRYSLNDLPSQAGYNFPSISQQSRDVLSITSEDDVFVDAVDELSLVENDARSQVLERQLQPEKEEKTRMQLNLLNKILSPLKDQHSYNQVLVIQNLINKSISDAPTVYNYVSGLIKREINNLFNKKLGMDFCTFCTQENPNIRLASEVLTELLATYNFYAITHPAEATISTVINTLFGLVKQ